MTTGEVSTPTPYTLQTAQHLYTLHPTRFSLHPTPYTLHPTPFALHLTPYARHPTPFALHATRYTRLRWGGRGEAEQREQLQGQRQDDERRGEQGMV